ncbi:hypothetical protein BC940DRAFT_300515 [Gongronella butleri]|nr:hypothetical protein BC940DRAFT_300515 [Gongronella butleri]
MKIVFLKKLDCVNPYLEFTVSRPMSLFGGLIKSTLYTFEIPANKDRVYAPPDDRTRSVREHTSIDHVYVMSSDRRNALLTFSAYVIAHLGIFAFLFQVFDDRRPIMQLCCYFQLGLLILCLIFYVASYGVDALFIFQAQALIKPQQREPIYDYYFEDHYLWCVDSTDNLPDITSMARQARSYELKTFSLLLDISFAICLILIESLTVVYIYQNVQTK